MTTLLTTKQTDALRSIGDSAIVLLALWMIDQNFPGRHTKPTELLNYLRPTIKDVRKLTAQLDALCASGRVAQTTAGYALIEGGKALVLGLTTGDDEVKLALSPASVAGTKPLALDQGTKAQVIDAVVSSADAEILSESAARNLRALKKIEEEDSLSLRDSDSSSSESAKNAQKMRALEIAPGVDTRRILQATAMLDGFENGVNDVKLPCEKIHPREALALIAHAYDQRTRAERPKGIDTPARFAFCSLRDGKRAQEKYRQGWESYLPEEFLMAVGLLSAECECGAVFETTDALKEHQAMMLICEWGCGFRCHTAEELNDHQKTHEPKHAEYHPLPETDRGARAWKVLREELQNELPKASYETWVKDGFAAQVDVDGETLVVAVRNEYAREWLESRLQNKVDAMIQRFSQRSIHRIRFVVGCAAEDE